MNFFKNSRLLRMSGLMLGVLVWLANSGNPPTGRTGAPFNGNCDDCHNTPTPSYAGNISLDGLPGTIIANQVYPLSITLTATGGSPLTGGFQMVVVDAVSNVNCGTLAAANGQTGTDATGGRTYIEQRGDKAFTAGEVTWNFNWTAPASVASNSVKFYYIGNLTNNNGNDGGDLVVLDNLTLPFSGPPPVSASINSTTNVTCFGGNNGSATVSASGGTGTFTYLWNNGQTNETATNLSAGTYTVTVTSGTTTTAVATITQPTAITASASSSGPLSCTNASVQLTATANGGTPGYNYVWSNGENGNPISVSTAGTYTVTVSDQNNCTKTAIATVTGNTTVPTADAGPGKTLTCGIAQVQLNGSASSNVSFQWTTATGNILSGGNTATPIVNQPGVYQLVVTHLTSGCTASDDVVVTANFLEPANVNAIGGTLNCAVTSITLQGSSSTPNVTYRWSGPGITPNNQNQQNPTVSTCGLYTLVVTNPVNGCTASDQTDVLCDQVVPSLSATGGTITCAQTQTTLTASSTTPNTVFQWTGPGINQTNQNLTNPTVSVCGAYTVVVTNTANGCTSSASVQVICDNTPPPLSTNNLTLNCTTTSGQVCASPILPNLTYLWMGPGGVMNTTSCLTANLPGTYTVVATAPNGCTSSANAVIADDTNPPVATAGPDGILNCNNATVQLNGTGSSSGSNFTYAWTTQNGNFVGGQTTLTPTVNAAGTYTFVVTNTANGCTSSDVAVVTVTPPVAATTQSVAVSCNGASTGTAQVTASGGNGVYSYLWTTGATTNSISGLPAGTYSVIVTDGENCTATSSVNVTQPDVLTANAVATNQTAVGVNDGTATATPAGGTIPYSYIWSSGQTTSAISALSPGAYTVTVADVNACSVVQTVTVAAFNCNSTATISSANISCFGASNGSAALSPNGIGAPYTYLWSNGATTSSVSGLNAGAIAVTMTDANGCQTFLNTNITEPAALSVNAVATPVTGVGTNDGTAAAAPVGGTSPYGYLWSNGATTALITGLNAGNYTVTITDQNNCTAQQTVTVNAFNCAISTSLSVINNNCYGNSFGSVSAIVSNGTQPYTYLWNNGATTSTLLDMPAGTYTVVVTDDAGCVASATGMITQPDEFIVTPIVTNPECLSQTGSVLYSFSGGTTPYPNAGPITNLVTGTYSVTLTDAAGCIDALQYTISPQDHTPPAITCPANIIHCSTAALQFPTPQATDNCGGNPQVELSSGLFNGSVFPLGVTTQVFLATDNAGNSATCSFTVTVFAPVSVEINTVVNDQNGAGIGSIQVTPFGVAPFTYEWRKNGQIYANTEDITGLTAGTYQLLMTDANGCTYSLGPIQIQNTVGTYDLNTDIRLKLWPNPANNLVFIEILGGKPLAASMLNAQGQLVMDISVDDFENGVDVSSLKTGLYYLKIITRSGHAQLLKWVKAE